MGWTEERIKTLKARWEEGVTASRIAEELGEVSRNAVIGKAHRLGLKARPSPVRQNEKAGNSGDEQEQEVKQVGKTSNPSDESKPSDEKDETARTESSATAPASAPAQPSQALPDRAQGMPKIVSVGPGGFLRQGPGDQQPPIPPAPPRRLVPAKPSPEIADKTSLLDLNEKVCRWPMGHPGEADFHFCGEAVNPGFPYCVEHCGRAYQAQLPRGARRPPPPLPFGGPRVR
jgi:GcrA cell cycle regulator